MCLIVHHEEAVRMYVKGVLEREQYYTVEAHGGVEALRLVRKLGHALDVIVSDIRMPGGDGLTFANAVREAFPQVAIVLTSGDADEYERRYTGATFKFLQKPFLPDTLILAIQEATKMMERGRKGSGTGSTSEPFN